MDCLFFNHLKQAFLSKGKHTSKKLEKHRKLIFEEIELTYDLFPLQKTAKWIMDNVLEHTGIKEFNDYSRLLARKEMKRLMRQPRVKKTIYTQSSKML